MCVAAVAWGAHPRWSLVAIGNRDEFHDRPAAPLRRWDDGTIAGKDLQGGGTWLGLTESGRFSLVTNYRVDGYPKPDRPSRGALVTNWLHARPQRDIAAMNPFNLLEISRDEAWHCSNHPTPARSALTPGIHGLSNGGFDDRWAKTLRLEAVLADWLATDDDNVDPLLQTLRDETLLPPLNDGPGNPLPGFTPVFIANPVYGTRCSTIIAIDRQGHGRVIERRFDAEGRQTGETRLNVMWPESR